MPEPSPTNPHHPQGQLAGLRRSPSTRLAPEFLAVFGSAAPENVPALAEALGAPVATVRPSRDGCQMLRVGEGVQSLVRLFPRLGIAALDLDPAARDRVERIAGVRVVANEVRRLPPYLVAAASESSVAGHQVVGVRRRAVHGGRGHCLAPENWCLTMLGIDPCRRDLTGRGIRVAVLDTGIAMQDGQMPKVVAAASFVAGQDVLDRNGHGTHCAGIVGGPRGRAGRMPYGVAPDCEILVGKVLDHHGVGTDDAIPEGISWAVEHGAAVVSLSVSSMREPGGVYPHSYEAAARSLLDCGTLLLAAAGNDSAAPRWLSPVGNPAACPSILAVSACDRGRLAAPFSNRELDSVGRLALAAPGVDVYSVWLEGGYRLLSGTSMATPHVAGVAALHAERGGARLRGRLLRDSLLAAAVPVGPRQEFGHGLAHL